MFKIHRILVPVDFTEVADAAISVALQLANQHEGAELVALHVREGLDRELRTRIETHPHDNAIMNAIEEDERSLTAAIAKEQQRALDAGHTLRSPTVRTFVSGGDWLDVCLQIIDDQQVDVVVVGTHGGPGGIKGALLGSASERLVHRAPCSVFVVKPLGYPYLRD